MNGEQLATAAAQMFEPLCNEFTERGQGWVADQIQHVCAELVVVAQSAPTQEPVINPNLEVYP